MFGIKYIKRRANVAGMLNISQLHYLGMIITHYLDITNYSKQYLISEKSQGLGINSFVKAEFQVNGGQAQPVATGDTWQYSQACRHHLGDVLCMKTELPSGRDP